MATSLQPSNTVDFSDAKLLFAQTEILANGETNAELRLRLLNVLQTTLDLDHMLELFLGEIKTAVKLDGLTYINKTQNMEIKIGKQSTHSCGYRLITPKDYLGELVFTRTKRFIEKDLATLEALLNTIVFPLRNALQYRQAVQTALTDPLTGAGNRIALETTSAREVELAKRHNIPLSVLMVDIDHFKKVNDLYGHGSGDAVLKEVVSTIKATIRQTDSVFRFGGEEFVILLSKTDQQGAIIIAERIRKVIEKCQLRVEEHTLEVSVSLGTSTLQNQDTLKDLISRADKALYKAKANGRNRVCSPDIGSQVRVRSA